MQDIFQYGEKEVAYLKKADKTLGAAIEQIGFIERAIVKDLFASLIRSIIAQQISAKAAETISKRMLERFLDITPERINNASIEEIQQLGMSMRKAGYIKDVAAKIHSGEFNIEALSSKSDEDVCRQLSSLNGIGVWTAEMLMIFTMQRPDILSWDDLAIQRGLRMLYRHRKITKELFRKYKRRYSPYATVASLYLWAIAGGACEMKDYAPKTEAQKKKVKRMKKGK